ncbi:hypothetical protein BFJ68_g11888 [Fusarium oxysporum]|uniref:Uncharacterized protein n=1 Tax=Fusarium oxysporum TaxID=5507 RepID=A0A420QCZ9_FUSOX|nr:hypothetical protein BFJ68_g11888 [Fusarium oxysporum]
MFPAERDNMLVISALCIPRTKVHYKTKNFEHLDQLVLAWRTQTGIPPHHVSVFFTNQIPRLCFLTP